MLIYDSLKRNKVIEIKKANKKKNSFVLFENGEFKGYFNTTEIEDVKSLLINDLGYLLIEE